VGKETVLLLKICIGPSEVGASVQSRSVPPQRYWSWWYGCAIGSVNFVTGSRSANAFGENIGGGLTFRLGESHLKVYTEVRYHHAGYNRVSTSLLPLTFGIRW